MSYQQMLKHDLLTREDEAFLDIVSLKQGDIGGTREAPCWDKCVYYIRYAGSI